MNLIKNYNDYMVDMILEGSSNGKLPFKFSKRFQEIVSSIEHPISKDMMMSEDENADVTLIDVGSKSDMVTMSTSPKIIDYLQKKLDKDVISTIDFYKEYRNNDIWNRNRVELKVGKLVKKMFDNKYPDSGRDGEDIQSFVNMYKAIFEGSTSLLEIVEGEHIIKWYDYRNYVNSMVGSPLHSSCMSHSECSEYLVFYMLNKDKVKMLVQYQDERKQKIVARALLWYLDEPVGRIFMDRIYYHSDSCINVFINYARQNKWLYKRIQNSHTPTQVVDSVDGTYSEDFKMMIEDIKLNRYYPYLDTFKFLYQDNRILSNVRLSLNEPYAQLDDTNGRVSYLNWSDYYVKYINNYDDDLYVRCGVGTDDFDDEDEYEYDLANKYRLKKDATYLPYYKDYIPNDILKKTELVQTTFGQRYSVLPEDALWLDDVKEYTTIQYAMSNKLV